MRQQYLIWNKDSVADETIFSDIEKLSNGRIQVPEGIELSNEQLELVAGGCGGCYEHSNLNC
jgi:hypothetical protein